MLLRFCSLSPSLIYIWTDLFKTGVNITIEVTPCKLNSGGHPLDYRSRVLYQLSRKYDMENKAAFPNGWSEF